MGLGKNCAVSALEVRYRDKAICAYRQVWVVQRACEVDSRTDYIAVVELCFDLTLGALIKLI